MAHAIYVFLPRGSRAPCLLAFIQGFFLDGIADVAKAIRSVIFGVLNFNLARRVHFWPILCLIGKVYMARFSVAVIRCFVGKSETAGEQSGAV